jgi:hypothetical protein
MRPLLLPLCLVSLAAAAEDKAAAKPEPAAATREAAIERVLSERESPDAFAKAVESAKKLGVSEQALLEARFLYAVDRQDDDGVAAMLPEFLARKDGFKLADSEIFAVNEDWLAVVEYVQAIAALKQGDRDAFKRHITEAFWLSPRQGAAFAPHIERLRTAEVMREVKLDLQFAFARLEGEGKVKLADALRDRKALLLHFWVPWSRESEDTLPEFTAMARDLESNGIAFASILADDSPKSREQARAMLAKSGAKPHGAWLVDDSAVPLSRTLRVQSIPVVALISPEGRVLFNGHVSRDELWETLGKLAPAIKRPAVETDEHAH